MTWFERKISQLENDLEFLTESKIIELNEKFVEKMIEKGISRVELAKRLGVTKPFVTKLLNGNPNMTIKTMMHIAQSLDCNIYFDLCYKWLKPKTLYALDNDSYTQFHPKLEGVDYADAA